MNKIFKTTNIIILLMSAFILNGLALQKDSKQELQEQLKLVGSASKADVIESTKDSQTNKGLEQKSIESEKNNKTSVQEKLWHITQKNTDIREFINQIAKIVGKTIVIDPKIKGGNTVTVLSSKALSANDVFEVFCQVMSVNGYAVVYKGDVINIIPQASSKNSVSFGSESDIHGVNCTQVIELKNIPAMEAVSIIKPLISSFGHIAGSTASNSVIVSDLLENVEKAKELLTSIDTASDYEVIQLEHAWVTDVANIINSTLNFRVNNTAVLQIIADENSNRLVVKGNKGKRDQIKKLVAILDNSRAQKNTTKVMFLKHADAQNIAEILAEASNSLINAKGGKKSSNGRPQGLMQSNVSKSGGYTYAAQAPGVFVKPDVSQNALVMIADPEILKELENIVHKLDIPRSQVLLEAVIVEVSDDLSSDFGINWQGLAKGDSIKPDGGLLSVNMEYDGFKHGKLDVKIGSLGSVVKALRTDGNNNILSTPSILTLDNTKSEFLVGENIPIKTGAYQTTGAQQSPFVTRERKDVGIQLKITPHINAGNSLRLSIEQEVSNVDLSASKLYDDGIVYKNRSLKTTVLVENGQTIVIGGLIQSTSGKSKSKIPILGDIPILGRLFFTQNGKTANKKNLMLFLRPTIVESANELSELTKDKYNSLKIIGANKKNANIIDMPDDYQNLVDYTATM
jgi:general secretion pathway protein D